MEGKDLNRLKVVLAEKKRTNKWLAEQIGVDQATVSKWCTNSAQPNLENLMEIAKCLGVTDITIRQWIRRGKLPEAINIGNEWFVPINQKYPNRKKYMYQQNQT